MTTDFCELSLDEAMQVDDGSKEAAQVILITTGAVIGGAAGCLLPGGQGAGATVIVGGVGTILAGIAY